MRSNPRLGYALWQKQKAAQQAQRRVAVPSGSGDSSSESTDPLSKVESPPVNPGRAREMVFEDLVAQHRELMSSAS